MNGKQQETKISRIKVMKFILFIVFISLINIYIIAIGSRHGGLYYEISKVLYLLVITASLGCAFVFFADIFVKLVETGVGRYSLIDVFHFKNEPKIYIVPGIIVLIFAFFIIIYLLEKYGLSNIQRALTP